MLAALTARDLGYIGTLELCDIISRTMSTVEKMEKWNGHLYNWYDTRTLETLRPRYISTVDSGNFVCYLITLKEGLAEYLNRPLEDRAFIDGIRDTASLIADENENPYKDISCLKECIVISEGRSYVDIPQMMKALTKLSEDGNKMKDSKDVWKAKVDSMIEMLKIELYTYMPWCDMIDELTEAFEKSEADIKEAFHGIIRKLNSDYSSKPCLWYTGKQ